MRGGSRYKKIVLTPDPKYNSTLVAKFINYLMLKGKKELARKVVYEALEDLGRRANQQPLEAFETVIKTVSPVLEVKSRRIGGATYQVPMEIRPERKVALSMRWLINAARSRQGKRVAILLADEMHDSLQGTGTAMKKREDLHKMAEANRAFAHFARF